MMRFDARRASLGASGIGIALPIGFGIALAIAAAGAEAGERDAVTDLPAAWAAMRAEAIESHIADAPSLDVPESDRSDASDKTRSDSADVRFGARKSYAIPAAEILGFEFLLNQFDRHVLGTDFASNASTIRRNLHSSWVVDRDPFEINQLGHPYAGSMYQAFARSAGLNYWESLGYTFAGSALWEIAGERSLPSRNDQINTGIGGSFLGEILFRLSNLTLEHENVPPFWRETAAALISPSVGFNRLAFGNRFRTIFASNDPIYFSRLQVGFSGTAQNSAGTSTTQLRRNEALVDYSIDYGLPGKPGYTYQRPFDYFSLQATASSANGFENLLTRGLLIGKDYEAGDNYRGVWGLYGLYDYIAPQTFRVSSTAAALGTTAQWKLSDAVALQGTGLAGRRLHGRWNDAQHRRQRLSLRRVAAGARRVAPDLRRTRSTRSDRPRILREQHRRRDARGPRQHRAARRVVHRSRLRPARHLGPLPAESPRCLLPRRRRQLADARHDRLVLHVPRPPALRLRALALANDCQ